MSVLAWRGVVTVGVSSPGRGSGEEIVLSSVTGKQIRTYRAGNADGAVTAVIGRALVLSSSSGLSMYSVASGYLTGQRLRAVAEWADPVRNVLYADIAGVLTGIDPATERNKPDEGAAIPGGVYGVHAGVALGLNPGDQGAAWGYSVAKRRVI